MHYCKIFVVNISCWIACHCLCELGINVDFFSTMIEILLPPTVSVGARRLKVVAVNTICNLWNTCQKQYLSYIGSYIVHLLFWEGAVIHVPEKGHENNYQHRHTLCPRKSCEIVIFCAELVCQNDATIPAVRCDISRQVKWQLRLSFEVLRSLYIERCIFCIFLPYCRSALLIFLTYDKHTSVYHVIFLPYFHLYGFNWYI